MTEISFPRDPRGYLTKGVYRVLQLTDPWLDPGWDVWGLQTALRALGMEVAVDGVFGPKTEGAVRSAQGKLEIGVDGKVAGQTYTAMVVALGVPVRKKYGVIPGLLYGQTWHESHHVHGCWSERHDDGHFDNGVAQENERYTPITQAMDVVFSLDDLGLELHEQFVRYRNTTEGTVRQCWKWASAHWNSPERADALAYGHTLSDEARKQITDYIRDCTAFVRW